MISTLHVLSIGSPNAATIARDVLVLRARCRLYVATSMWELSVVIGSEDIDVALLHNTFSLRELLIFAAYIRDRWPCAKILLIQDTDKNSDYSMYDEQINPDAKATVFLAAIERLAALSRRAKRPLAITRSAQKTRAEDVSAA